MMIRVGLFGAVVAAALAVSPTLVAGQAGAPAPGELGFTLPDGYVQQRANDIVVLAPANASDRTPCLYGIAGRQPALDSLEASAEAALARAVVPGWQRLDDRHAAMRGTAAAGWPYAWYRAAFVQTPAGGQRQAVNAMAMVMPAEPGRVHLVWAMGLISRCLADDASFEQLFHGLRPPGWRSDGGLALTRALLGTWRFSASEGLQQLTFKPGGVYDRDLGTRAQLGVSSRISAAAGSGRYTLDDGGLTLTPDHRPAAPDRYRIRVYDEWQSSGGWRSALAVLDDRAASPSVVQYYRVNP